MQFVINKIYDIGFNAERSNFRCVSSMDDDDPIPDEYKDDPTFYRFESVGTRVDGLKYIEGNTLVRCLTSLSAILFEEDSDSE